MASIGEVSGKLSLQDQFTSALKRAESQFVQTSKRFQSIGQNMTRVGGDLTRSLTLPIVAVGGASVKAFADFDQAMTKSTAIMGDVSDALRTDMAESAREMAKETVFSANQAAESYFFLASAGLDAQQSIAALPQVAAFAQAGAFDMALATDLLTDAQSALGLTIRDDVVKNMENMARVSDVLAKANVLANATIEQFSFALTREAGAALKSFNIDVEEGVAVLAAFADQGVKGEIAGTGLSRILRLLTAGVEKNKAAFEQYNVEVFDSQGNINNLADIIEDLEKAFDGMSDQARVSALEQLGFSARVQGVLLPLIGTSDAIRKYEAELRSAGGTTQEVADNQLQSFSNQMKLVLSRLVEVGIELGSTLGPIILKFTQGVLVPLINAASLIVKIFGNLPAPVQAAAVAVAGMAAALGPLLIGMGSLIRLVGFAAGGFAKLAALLHTTVIPAIVRYTVAADGATAATTRWLTTLGRIAAIAGVAVGAAVALGVAIKQQNTEVDALAKNLATGPFQDVSKQLASYRAELERLTKIPLNQATPQQIVQVRALRQAIEELEKATRLTVVQLKQFSSTNVKGDLDGISEAALRAAAGLPPVTSRTEDLEGRLEALSKAAEESARRLEELRRQHESNMQAIQDEAELRQLHLDVVQMLTEDINAQVESMQQLTQISQEFNNALDADLLERSSSALRELFPDQAELRRLEDMKKALEDLRLFHPEMLSQEELQAALDKLQEKIDNIGKTGTTTFAEWMQVSQQAAGVIGDLNSDLGNAIQSLLSMVAAFYAIAAAATAAEAASGWIALIGAAIGLIAGLGGGGSTTKGETGSVPFEGGQFFGEELDKLREVIDANLQALFFDISAFTQGLLDQLVRFEKEWADQMGSVLATIGGTTDMLADSFEVTARTHIFEDKVTQTWRVMFDGIETTFEDAALAAAFAIRETLRRSDLASIDTAVRQAIESATIPLDAFTDSLERVQELADTASMAVDGVSALELEMRKLPGKLDAVRLELEQMGLSADQVSRLVGGQLVASFQAWRQQITGEELSMERRREIAEAQRQLFNAQLELQIAQLEADKNALLAEAGLTQREIELVNAQLTAQSAALQGKGQIAQSEATLEGRVIDARSRFVKASGDVFNAELGVMKGFVEGGAAIVEVGARVIGTLGDVLSSLPEEIRKQVVAIQKVIDALKKIGTIRPGDIRIPGIPRVGGGGGVPSIPSSPGGPSGPDPIEEFLDKVMDMVDALDALAQQTIDTINELQDAVAGLQEFRDSLHLGATSILPPVQQVAEARRQLEAAAARFRAGDISAAEDVQRLAQELLQLGAGVFGTAGAGFQGIFRFVDELVGDVIADGNDLTRDAKDFLESINEREAEILQKLVDNGLIEQAIVEAIRERGIQETEATRNVHTELANLRKDVRKQLAELANAIVKELKNVA